MSRIPQDVQLMGRKAQIVSASYDQVLNVAAGGNTTITVTPPTGELWKIKGLYVNIPVPTGATANQHTLFVLLGGSDIFKNRALSIVSNFGDLILIRGTVVEIGTNSKTPSTDTAQQNSILNLVATQANPLRFYYSNGTTGGNQTGTMSITVTREVEYIV